MPHFRIIVSQRFRGFCLFHFVFFGVLVFLFKIIFVGIWEMRLSVQNGHSLRVSVN